MGAGTYIGAMLGGVIGTFLAVFFDMPVLVIVTIISLIVRVTSGGSLFGVVGLLILVMLPVAIISSRIMWKKGIIKVVDNVEKEEE